MLQSRHPGHGRCLGRSFEPKSARAYDATVSAPKSVSVLWALSPEPFVRAEVLAAHDAAVVAALDWLEHHGGVTRRGKDGVHQVDAQGLVAALFRQHTSREADPQLHTHAVIWGKVQDPTGKWLSLAYSSTSNVPLAGSTPPPCARSCQPVSVADAPVVLGRESQVGDEVLEVVLQAGDRRRVELAPLRCERLGPSPGDRLGGVAGLGVDVVEDRPELGLHLRLGMDRHLGEKVLG